MQNWSLRLKKTKLHGLSPRVNYTDRGVYVLLTQNQIPFGANASPSLPRPVLTSRTVLEKWLSTDEMAVRVDGISDADI
jgi:hypothetical protein